MTPLPVVEQPEGLLAFDFDGTLHWPSHEPPVDKRLLQWIQFLRDKRKMIWGICTGRSIMHLMEGLAGGCFEFLPDFAITREREIFFPGKFNRFQADEEWNKQCEEDHWRLFKSLKPELLALRGFVEDRLSGEWVEQPGDLAGVVLRQEEDMEALLAEFDRLCGRDSKLGYERNSIYLRFSHIAYGKGPVLKEISDRCALSPEQVVACGDNHNDLSMLNPVVTNWPICPSNSVQEVKDQVTAFGGIVADSPASEGLVEAFEEIFLS
ncbi:MAG: HAD hydrolase family protein [Verrucomicrobiota bacterium JB023]|nr:HAD hydrolase family protein [Verrucomicrobiota bacterium JB023]